MRCNPTNSQAYAKFQKLQNINSQPAAIFCSVRFYLYVAVLPNVATTIYTGQTLAVEYYQGLLLNPDGSLTAEDGVGVTATSSQKLITGQWYQISFAVDPRDGFNSVSVSVDGVPWASLTSSVGNTIVYNIPWIGAGLAENVTCDLYFDDILWDDGSSGAVTIGPGKQILSTPASDVAIGNWTGGAGGTTNLYQAVGSVPPAGLIPPGTNASQIRNANSAVPSDYTATVQSYNAAGVPSGTSVNAVVAFVLDGLEQLGITFGSLWIASNPTQSVPTQAEEFTYGAGIPISSSARSWNPDEGVVISNPTLNLLDSPTVSLRKVTSASTPPPKHGVGTPIGVDAELLGVYVDYVG